MKQLNINEIRNNPAFGIDNEKKIIYYMPQDFTPSYFDIDIDDLSKTIKYPQYPVTVKQDIHEYISKQLCKQIEIPEINDYQVKAEMGIYAGNLLRQTMPITITDTLSCEEVFKKGLNKNTLDNGLARFLDASSILYQGKSDFSDLENTIQNSQGNHISYMTNMSLMDYLYLQCCQKLNIQQNIEINAIAGISNNGIFEQEPSLGQITVSIPASEVDINNHNNKEYMNIELPLSQASIQIVQSDYQEYLGHMLSKIENIPNVIRNEFKGKLKYEH